MTRLTTSSNNRTYYKDVDVDLSKLTEVVVSEVAYPSQGDEPCVDPNHKEDRYTMGCMWHDYKHVVGGMCFACGKQWLFSPDWSSPECRATRLQE